MYTCIRVCYADFYKVKLYKWYRSWNSVRCPCKEDGFESRDTGPFFIGMRQCETAIENYPSPSCLRKPVSEGINAYVGGIKTQRLTKYRAILMDHILVHGPLCICLRTIMAWNRYQIRETGWVYICGYPIITMAT